MVAQWHRMAQAEPDSDEPIVTNAMIAAGLSQLPRIDRMLAEITRTLRRVYVQMWRLRGV